MILEHALLDVRADQEADFERDFATAQSIISTMAGFGRLSLSRCLERPGRYLLLVEWARLEDHTEGFRGSAGYQRWRDLLHHYYDPFPTVEHYSRVLETIGRGGTERDGAERDGTGQPGPQGTATSAPAAIPADTSP
ncbi:MAG TPA: antibiotic biosynthesis monooxygenase [Kineosporiaceae bacterium]|nr:antibiotic biosynthesis monooxygenase [Kineosporiaceae bacterium]